MGELQMDKLDLSTHLDQVPKWPEQCRECLRLNRCDPDMALFCPPDMDCPNYPFKGEEAKNG